MAGNLPLPSATRSQHPSLHFHTNVLTRCAISLSRRSSRNRARLSGTLTDTCRSYDYRRGKRQGRCGEMPGITCFTVRDCSFCLRFRLCSFSRPEVSSWYLLCARFERNTRYRRLENHSTEVLRRSCAFSSAGLLPRLRGLHLRAPLAGEFKPSPRAALFVFRLVNRVFA